MSCKKFDSLQSIFAREIFWFRLSEFTIQICPPRANLNCLEVLYIPELKNEVVGGLQRPPEALGSEIV